MAESLEAVEALVGFLVRFVLGTTVLWLCSLTTSSPNANLKTAAIYNGIMQLIFLGITLGFVVLLAVGVSAGWTLFLLVVLALLIGFALLMWLYEISILSAIWLIFAMIAVTALAGRILQFFF